MILSLKSSVPSRLIKNSRGFALVETIVALAILSFALVGLMTMVQYVRIKANVNYHEKYVLLKVDGEMQRLKYRHYKTGTYKPLAPVVFTIPQLNGYGINQGRRITVRVTFVESNYTVDMAVSRFVKYRSVTANAEWEEHIPFLSKSRIEKRYLELREDYFEKDNI